MTCKFGHASTVSSVKSRVTFKSVDFQIYTYSCGIGDLFSLDTALVVIRRVQDLSILFKKEECCYERIEI